MAEEPLKSDRAGAQSFPMVSAAFAVLLAIGVTLGLAIHRRYVAFERVAARHVPAGAALVARWDVEKVSLFEPTRRFLLPLLDAAREGGEKSASRTQRLDKGLGINVGRDLREVLVVIGPKKDEWAVAAGASFRNDALLAGTARVLAGEGWSWRASDAVTLLSPEGLALGLAPDGLVALASSPEALGSVTPVGPGDPGILRTGAGTLVVRLGQPGLPASVRDFLRPLGDLAELRLEATWGIPLPLELTLRYTGEPPADARARLHDLIRGLVGEHLARVEREHGALSLKPAQNREIRARLLLDDGLLEALADRLGAMLGRQIRAGSSRK